MIGSNLDKCKRGPPTNEINGLGTSGGRSGGGGSGQWQTHTHTMSPVIYRVDGASGNDWTQS